MYIKKFGVRMCIEFILFRVWYSWRDNVNNLQFHKSERTFLEKLRLSFLEILCSVELEILFNFTL
jgi:hypothetical protein